MNAAPSDPNNNHIRFDFKKGELKKKKSKENDHIFMTKRSGLGNKV